MTEQSTSRSSGKQALSWTTGENIHWYALSTEGDLAVPAQVTDLHILPPYSSISRNLSYDIPAHVQKDTLRHSLCSERLKTA